jgi:hypothetical protein
LLCCTDRLSLIPKIVNSDAVNWDVLLYIIIDLYYSFD